ncbi:MULTISPECIES: CsoS2 family carboxysome shell protein [unclassified Ectothiorhodospira]|uniref:CsoS2 family carboxysome shell protein n=1 Tax=unclassified Ectothiorhodospira TaxID=2684909 RepID=UPI001EE84E8B|nr:MULTISPECIES: CsoS2 family carboxysome shell protein [unclassified Ectothiorhodospira]MCG5517006.1 carboxysome shell protein [Ectothiorhodospira sp. 9100]MCG5519213.1 carboxysome shell protein [Ectothiorhodospira sp. 9905]
MPYHEQQTLTGRAASQARRRAQAAGGKAALSTSRTDGHTRASATAAAPQAPQQPVVSAAPRSEPPPGQSIAPASPSRRTRAGAQAPASDTRAKAQARRQALASAGKRADRSADRTRQDVAPSMARPAGAGAKQEPEQGECQCGGACRSKNRDTKHMGQDLPRSTHVSDSGQSTRASASSMGRSDSNSTRRGNGRRRATVNQSQGRLQAMARRQAQAGRGKAAAHSPPSAASLARQANPRLSGRELAQAVRDQRSRAGGVGTRKSAPTGRQRPAPSGAQDQPWKVGVMETAHGQHLTGTRVGRSQSVTGDEASTCRAVTGTEYLGAEIFREFCQTDAPRGPVKVGLSSTGAGSTITGSRTGHSERVTGNESGSCTAVTGNQYLSAEHFGTFCTPASGSAGTKDRGPANVPPKVGQSETLHGQYVTGAQVGRSARVTGDEPGTCRMVTGDEYLGSEQYEAFCGSRPEPLEPERTGQSTTLGGQRVSGTRSDRSNRVTGNEPGTCKSVTGTPYAGMEQSAAFCAPEERERITERVHPRASTPGPRATGIQPGIGGDVTGDDRGACEAISGTPYLGVDQFAEACDTAALPGQPDFPQALDGAPWQHFSVASPARQADQTRRKDGVTGTAYEQGGRITGPFGMAGGKITGTEEARFDRRTQFEPVAPAAGVEHLEEQPSVAAGMRSRVTGEGQSTGTRITGDDWERGERVTGTEGSSARRRNPTRVGSVSAMPSVERKRNEDTPPPVSRVTGGSGNTDRGSLVTYSGGARG